MIQKIFAIAQKSNKLKINYKLIKCAKNSGRDIDKIVKMNLTLAPAQKLKTPIIKECFSHLECKLYDTLKFGDHTLFIGEVVNVMADKNAYKKDLLDNEKIKPTYYIGGNIFTSISNTKGVF